MAASAFNGVASPRLVPARAGIGLRAVHHHEIQAQLPDVGWLEAHSENYFATGGASHAALEALRQHYPISLHGVGLSVGGTDPLDRGHLAELRAAVDRYQPALVSEHLCWSAAGGRHTNDLLPLPFTQEALRHVIGRVAEIQDVLGRSLLIENVSSYLEFRGADMSEWEFLAALAKHSGCGILLDVNNIYVSSRNHGFDACDYLEGIPRAAVGEIHLAGHSSRDVDGTPMLIDTHDGRVCDEVWQLYARAIARFGALPTLIEWDADLPELGVLVAEAHTADRIAGETRALAA
jgi:uncharacterized protein (UPF0276 family)